MNTKPTNPGWYRTAEGVNDWLLYSLDAQGNWGAHSLNGDGVPCDWGYIEQAGDLELVLPWPRAEQEKEQG